MNVRNVLGHALTAGLTLLLAAIWLGPRAGVGWTRATDPFSAARPTAPPVAPLPDLAADPDLAEALRLSDAEEQINIRVYDRANRGVVNITTASLTPGIFDDVVSSGSGSGFVVDDLGHIL